MAHWIIEDKCFGGCYYRCSDCGEGFWDIFDDVGGEDFCPKCGAFIDDEKNEYVNETRAPKKNEPFYILLTEEELIDLGTGYVIDIELPNGETARVMNREWYDDMVGEKEEN